MTPSTSVQQERMARLTRLATYLASASLGLALAILGGMAMVGSSAAANHEAKAKTLDEEIAAVQAVLEEARSKASTSVRTQSLAVADFQQSVTALAGANGCELAEFLASTDVQPFLSRFVKQGQMAGWSQMEVQVTLLGPSASVLHVLGQLAEQSVPIEFNNLQIAREKVTEAGTVVRAKAMLRILVQTGGSPA
jgi:hypothetical protein